MQDRKVHKGVPVMYIGYAGTTCPFVRARVALFACMRASVRRSGMTEPDGYVLTHVSRTLHCNATLMSLSNHRRSFIM